MKTTSTEQNDEAVKVLADMMEMAKKILEINFARLNHPTWQRIEEAKHVRAILKEAHDFLTR